MTILTNKKSAQPQAQAQPSAASQLQSANTNDTVIELTNLSSSTPAHVSTASSLDVGPSSISTIATTVSTLTSNLTPPASVSSLNTQSKRTLEANDAIESLSSSTLIESNETNSAVLSSSHANNRNELDSKPVGLINIPQPTKSSASSSSCCSSASSSSSSSSSSLCKNLKAKNTKRNKQKRRVKTSCSDALISNLPTRQQIRQQHNTNSNSINSAQQNTTSNQFMSSSQAATPSTELIPILDLQQQQQQHHFELSNLLSEQSKHEQIEKSTAVRHDDSDSETDSDLENSSGQLDATDDDDDLDHLNRHYNYLQQQQQHQYLLHLNQQQQQHDHYNKLLQQGNENDLHPIVKSKSKKSKSKKSNKSAKKSSRIGNSDVLNSLSTNKLQQHHSKYTSSNSITFNMPKSSTNASIDDEQYYNNNSEDEYEQRPILNNRQAVMNKSDLVIHADNIDELEAKFRRILKEKKGFIIKPMKEDGACLFRAVADQIYGDEEMHSTIRHNCMDYIAKNADYFKQYMTEDVNRYISRKRQDTCFGNHIEMIAMAEIYNRPIEVYEYSTEPKNTFQSEFQTDYEPIRLSYHGRNHYNSVVDPHKATIGVGLGLPQLMPGLAEKNLMSEALKKSEEFHLEQTMLDDKLKATDWEATNEEIMELVARESYLQWLKDNEKRMNHRGNSTLSANNTYLNLNHSPNAATCSNWENRLSPTNNNTNNTNKNSLKTNTSRRPSSNSTPPPQPLVLGTQMTTSPNSSSKLSKSSPRSSELHKKDEQLGNNSNTQKQFPFSSENLFMYDDEHMQYYENKTLMNELAPDLYGITGNDWTGLDEASNNDNDILARVLAVSQQEYLDSLKAKHTTTKNQ